MESKQTDTGGSAPKGELSRREFVGNAAKGRRQRRCCAGERWSSAQGLPDGVRDVAGDGRFELYKTTQRMDGPYHVKQHGFDLA